MRPLDVLRGPGFLVLDPDGFGLVGLRAALFGALISLVCFEGWADVPALGLARIAHRIP